MIQEDLNKNEDKKEENKRNVANNGQAIRTAAQVAAKSPDPYVGGAAKVFVAADKLTGGKASELAAKQLEKKKRKIIISVVASSIPIFLMLTTLFIVVFFVLGLFEIKSEASGGGTGISGSSSTECGFTISATSLSKEEYKSKLEAYANNKNSNFAIFAENADDIYEYAKSKNVNPELVAIRASVEGNGTITGQNNNYWGMGCTNTSRGEDCYAYNTFEEGYIDFINNISQYTSLANMMSKYSYIGDYWYSIRYDEYGKIVWGDGGCAYAPYIYNEDNMPDSVKNACASTAPVCSIEDTTNCIPTTAEDQQAYKEWQVDANMSNARFEIFGLHKEDGPCSTSSGTIQYSGSYNENGQGLKLLHKNLTANEIQALNNHITSEVNDAGYGTGAAVASAGQALVVWLEQQGYYLPYYWGGGHSSFIGANSSWGQNITCDSAGRCHEGFDCSGFVSWAIRTACNPGFGSKDTATMVKSNFGPSISIEKAKPGDLILKNGHVRLVIKNNGNGSVTAAESLWEVNGSAKAGGLVFTTQTTNSQYKIIDMSSYYKNNCKAS